MDILASRFCCVATIVAVAFNSRRQRTGPVFGKTGCRDCKNGRPPPLSGARTPCKRTDATGVDHEPQLGRPCGTMHNCGHWCHCHCGLNQRISRRPAGFGLSCSLDGANVTCRVERSHLENPKVGRGGSPPPRPPGPGTNSSRHPAKMNGSPGPKWPDSGPCGPDLGSPRARPGGCAFLIRMPRPIQSVRRVQDLVVLVGASYFSFIGLAVCGRKQKHKERTNGL